MKCHLKLHIDTVIDTDNPCDVAFRQDSLTTGFQWSFYDQAYKSDIDR